MTPNEEHLVNALHRFTEVTRDAGVPASRRVGRVRLLTILLTHFTEDDLHNIAFALDVDTEQLHDDTKAALARSLIVVSEQTNRYDELIALCRDIRPEAIDAHQPDPKRTRSGVQ